MWWLKCHTIIWCYHSNWHVVIDMSHYNLMLPYKLACGDWYVTLYNLMSPYKLACGDWYVTITWCHHTNCHSQRGMLSYRLIYQHKKQINHQKTGCFTDMLLTRLKCQCVKYITILRLMGADLSWCMLHKAPISSLCTQLPMLIQGEVDKSLYMF